MDITISSKQELINNIIKTLSTSSKVEECTEEGICIYNKFLDDVKNGNQVKVDLPLYYVFQSELFNLIKIGKVFVEKSVKFVATFTNIKPTDFSRTVFESKFVGNELKYSFLDNHPGIINIDSLKDIPVDYEGLMAVPPTILDVKNIHNFNIHRFILTPKYHGKSIYARIVISNKFTTV